MILKINQLTDGDSTFNVYSKKPHKVGDKVEVYSNGVLKRRGKIVLDFSKESKYTQRKRLNGEDVLFNAGKGYYQVKLYD